MEKISAILSDYDGTLCPTASIRNKENIIPEELENILWDISEKILFALYLAKILISFIIKQGLLAQFRVFWV